MNSTSCSQLYQDYFWVSEMPVAWGEGVNFFPKRENNPYNKMLGFFYINQGENAADT